MNNLQKGSVVPILTIIIVFLLIVIGYLFFKSSTLTNKVQNVSENTQQKTLNITSNTETTTNNGNVNIADSSKTYTDNQNGFSLKYPANTVIAKTKTGDGTPIVSFKVPFDVSYEKFNSKSFGVLINNGSCSDIYQNVLPQTKTTINGVEYYYRNPDWTETSGMSSISYFKEYYRDYNSKCYRFMEDIRGTGTNETPPGATSPSNFKAFFDSEMKSLDSIMFSVVFS